MEPYIFYEVSPINVSGKQLLKNVSKYYISDLGIRNLILPKQRYDLGFSLENVIFFELKRRGYEVWVGKLGELEIDFVVNKADERCYIQSALSVADPEKKEQETASLVRIPDSFRKIVVTKDYMKPWRDENGIQYVGIEDFLLSDSL